MLRCSGPLTHSILPLDSPQRQRRCIKPTKGSGNTHRAKAVSELPVVAVDLGVVHVHPRLQRRGGTVCVSSGPGGHRCPQIALNIFLQHLSVTLVGARAHVLWCLAESDWTCRGSSSSSNSSSSAAAAATATSTTVECSPGWRERASRERRRAGAAAGSRGRKQFDSRTPGHLDLGPGRAADRSVGEAVGEPCAAQGLRY